MPAIAHFVPLDVIMEDCNSLVSDCIVVSCCCQCLILQLVLFIFIHLPKKLARKAREYTKKKLSRRRRKSKGEKSKDHRHRDGFVGFDDGRSMSMRILELEGIGVSKLHRWGSCSDEVDRVLEELSVKGKFAFGSFWGGKEEQNVVGLCCKCSRTLTKEEVLEFGSHVVKFHFIEVVGPSFGTA